MGNLLLRMDDWHSKALERLARRNGMTKSGLIRFLIMKMARGEIRL